MRTRAASAYASTFAVADLAITQLMQMRVPEKERGTVSVDCCGHLVVTRLIQRLKLVGVWRSISSEPIVVNAERSCSVRISRCKAVAQTEAQS